MRLSDGMGALPNQTRSAWRWFPLGVVGAMSVVVAVNATMIYSALHTFPGKAGNDGFDLSNRYNAVLDRVAAEQALGWQIKAEADTSRHPVLILRSKDGAGLRGAHLEATAERPLGERLTTRVAFHETAPGRYVGDAALPADGQWELQVSVAADGHEIAATRRVVIR